MTRLPLSRVLSKRGVLSRAEAKRAIAAGRVRVDGRVRHDPLVPVSPDARIEVDGAAAAVQAWRAVAFHKPRGVVTTRRDPRGRPTVFDLLGEEARGLVAVGRLDLATSGLLLLTSDTALANWLSDPANAVTRTYLVTVRGRVTGDELATLTSGVDDEGERLSAVGARVRKASNRESHLVVELAEGRNREVRRLCTAIGHEVTRLRRVQVGGIELGRLEPGRWRRVTRDEVRRAFPGAPISCDRGA